MDLHDNAFAEDWEEQPHFGEPRPSQMSSAVIRQYARAYVDLGPDADVRGLIAN